MPELGSGDRENDRTPLIASPAVPLSASAKTAARKGNRLFGSVCKECTKIV